MRKLGLILASALLGAVLASALPAGAHHAATSVRLANRVADLEYLVANLEASVDDLDHAVFECLSAQGMTTFGIPDAGEGFVYEKGGTFFLTTGLDFDDSGHPDVWSITADEDCIAMSGRELGSAFKRLDAGRHRLFRR